MKAPGPVRRREVENKWMGGQGEIVRGQGRCDISYDVLTHEHEPLTDPHLHRINELGIVPSAERTLLTQGASVVTRSWMFNLFEFI